MSARRLLAWSASAALLAAVFAAWLQPDVVLALATQLWSCL